MNSREILVALRRIMRAIDLHSKQLEKSVGLTVPQLLVLQVLEEHGPLAVGELARRVNLSQGTVTSLLGRLVARDLVSRERSESDRRRVTIGITDAGQSRIEHCPNLLQEDFIERFNELEQWERNMLTAALQRIAAMMDAEHVDASPILQVGEIRTSTLAIAGAEEPPGTAPGED